MKRFNFLLGIFFLLGFCQTSNGQNSKEIITDRFAYSCGVLAGTNFQDIGLSKDLIIVDKLWSGIEAFMTGQSKITEVAAQKMTKAKTIELQNTGDLSQLTKASLSDFYYNYGIVIGANWKTFKIDFSSVGQEDFKQGILAVFSNTALFSAEEAQKEVSLKFKAIKEMEAQDQQHINKQFLKKNKTKPGIIALESGIQYEILKEGSGKQVSNNSKELITVHYHGTLINGKIFDSSVQKGKPITFKLTGVIKGWQEVIPLMEEGEKIRAYIPPYLGYGNKKTGNIPPNSILIFEIELIKVGQ